MTALQNYAEKNHYDLLSKFETLKEFNSHFEQSMLLHKGNFTKSEYIALNKLRKFAANFFGVAWCKIQKAVAGTHQEEMFGVSRSTFERMLRKAKKLNLITVIAQERENKWRKHNVYVFNRLEELVVEEVEIVSISQTIDVAENEKIDAPISINLLELPKLKDLNTYPQAESVPVSEKVINLFEEKTDYQHMTDLVKNLFDDKKIVYRMYGAWLGQSRKLFRQPPFELALQATKILISEVKRRKSLELINLYNPVGYFNGALKKLIDKWIEDNLRRYEEDWQQAMIEDGSAFEPVDLAIVVTGEEIESARPNYNWLDKREYDVLKTDTSIPVSRYFYNWLDER